MTCGTELSVRDTRKEYLCRRRGSSEEWFGCRTAYRVDPQHQHTESNGKRNGEYNICYRSTPDNTPRQSEDNQLGYGRLRPMRDINVTIRLGSCQSSATLLSILIPTDKLSCRLSKYCVWTWSVRYFIHRDTGWARDSVPTYRYSRQLRQARDPDTGGMFITRKVISTGYMNIR